MECCFTPQPEVIQHFCLHRHTQRLKYVYNQLLDQIGIPWEYSTATPCANPFEMVRFLGIGNIASQKML